MKASKINASNESHDSATREASARAKQTRFREHYDMKVEKIEEEKKHRSIFELIAEENPFAAPMKFSLSSPCDAVQSANIMPLSKTQSDWIVAETDVAIIHCIKNGIKETSVRLDGTSFIGSPLEGVELIIKEFCTAPLIFNLEFRGSPSAMSFLQPHLLTLSAVFHADKKKEYSIHRIELETEDSSPFLFHRKPSPDGHANLAGG